MILDMSQLAHRQFYNFNKATDDPRTNKDDVSPSPNEDHRRERLLTYIRENIIGNETAFTSPFGPRKIVYCDYTASGRSLQFIEDYIVGQVLPQYGSTHTTTSVTSLQTSLFRHEARDIIRNAVRASEHDRIIFSGSGATGAFHKLLHGLNQTPVVFVDFLAHHSLLLPWREYGATVVRVRETSEGGVDLNHLESLLKRYQSSQMIGCFTAASNITGIIVDDIQITTLLHRYGALSIWDFATAAPYVDIVMNPVLPNDPSGLAYKDAIFFSLHKFIGGVQTPGVLIVKKNLFKNVVPTECGGGTVFFVSRESHRYLKDVEEREEGGTPPIVETIRGGMVMQLKMNLNPSFILEKSYQLSKLLSELVPKTPELVPLGNMDPSIPRLPIMSFLVKHLESGKFLHYNFVCAVLNDVFGIQSRGGCACAGPYAQDLLGIDEILAKKYETLLMENPSLDRSHLRRKEEHSNVEVLRPGFVRINIPFTSTDEQVSFILSSIQKVCKDGWKLLPQYTFNPETGEWKHFTNLVFKHREWLQNISYADGVFEPNLKSVPTDSATYSEVLDKSDDIFSEALKVSQRMKLTDETLLFTEDAKALCWFLCPSEAKNYLNKSNLSPKGFCHPFVPVVYPLSKDVINNRPEYIWSNVNKDVAISRKLSQLSVLEHLKSNETVLNNIKEPTNIKNKSDNTSLCKFESEVISDGNTCLIRQNPKEYFESTKSNSKSRWVPPTKNIFNPTVEAVQYYNMIQQGDKVLVCLSGGKDSLSLLHTLHQYQFYSKAKGIFFTLGAVTVDPQSSSYDPRPLIPYLASLNVPYFFEEQSILKQAMELPELNSICSFCSRMKRGRIYAAARREGYNVLALGQHLDDLAESFLMSTFHNGRLRTMKACYDVREGDLRVIRPFAYAREKDLRYFAESNKLPIIPENCPGCFESPKERHRVKQLLAQQEVLFPRLFWSLKTALLPLLSIRKTGIENTLFGKQLTSSSCADDDDEWEEKSTNENPKNKGFCEL